MGKHTVAKKQPKKMKNIKKIKTILIIFVIILIIFLIVKNLDKTKSKDYISLIINNQDITEQLENQILIQDGVIYLSFEDVKKCLDETIYQEDDTIITTSEKKVAALEIDNRDIEINGANVEINGQAFKTEEGIIYIPISELKNVYDIELSYIESTKNIVIDYYSKSLVKAYASKNLSVKSEESSFSDTISKINKGNWVVFISEENGWAKVRTQDGFLGYVKSKNLTNFVTQREDMEETNTNTDENYLEKDISDENIQKYENRKELTEELLSEAVSKNCKAIRITYDNKEESFERFKIESKPILKECGINIIFE